MITKTQNLYSILEITSTATKEEIKKSYRKLLFKYHPDTSKRKNNTKKLMAIKNAYDILSDDILRARYDKFGSINISNVLLEDVAERTKDIFGSSMF